MIRFAAAILTVSLLGAADMTVYKTPTCGCCGKWIEHVRVAGIKVKVVEVPSTAAARSSAGIKEKYGSCHTGMINGYAIEVPVADILRLIKEKPKAKGLAVPGMPMGSPGMEGPYKDAYSVLLITEEGSTVFQNYAGSR
ncbi:MAG: DUF411 domain-containing protein [Acidobacteria bacterium]|nr:DUF411 domain-containing protein [Acidobacteriota bacterium]